MELGHGCCAKTRPDNLAPLPIRRAKKKLIIRADGRRGTQGPNFTSLLFFSTMQQFSLSTITHQILLQVEDKNSICFFLRATFLSRSEGRIEIKKKSKCFSSSPDFLGVTSSSSRLLICRERRKRGGRTKSAVYLLRKVGLLFLGWREGKDP